MYRGSGWKANPLIYLPVTVEYAKADRLKQQGAHIVLHGSDAVETETEARRVAAAEGLVYISPYNDAKVCAA